MMMMMMMKVMVMNGYDHDGCNNGCNNQNKRKMFLILMFM